MPSSTRIPVHPSSLLLLALSACRVYCEEDDYFCEPPVDGLHVSIQPPEAGFRAGEWKFVLDVRAPETATGELLCEVRADVPGQLLCQDPVGFEEPYRLVVNSATLEGLDLSLTRDGVEPLAREGVDIGLSGPTELRVAVLHDGVTQRTEELEPEYESDEMKSGPEVCVVCLGAEERIEL